MVLSATCSSGKQSSSTAPPAEPPPARGKDRPNILFLFSDDHGAPDLGCYGNTAVHTPNLDALASRGIRFDRAYVASPQCSPSRSAVVTGRTPHATGTSRLHAPLRGHETVIGALAEAGYFVAIYRKLHLGPEIEAKIDLRKGPKEPFSSFFEARPTDRPFFLQIGFDDPHRPYEGRAFDPAHDPEKVIVPSFLPDTPKVRADLANYYDEIARMDAEVGEIIELLDRHGLTDNTFIIFAGDHGMPFPGAKGSLYEPGVHIPLIAAWPKEIAAGQTSDALVSLVDLAPTWVEAAGVAKLPQVEGRSLLPAARAQKQPPREAVFMERNWHDNLDLIRAARGQRYKLIYNYLHERPYRPTLDLEESPTWEALVALEKAGRLSPHHRRRYFGDSRPRVELYDLESDPEERKNLAAKPEHADALKKMQGLLTEWMKETNDLLPPPLGEYPASHHP